MTEITVTGMTCEGCENVVETAVEMVDGVQDADADRHEDVVVVDGDPDEAAIAEKVRMAGYESGE